MRTPVADEPLTPLPLDAGSAKRPRPGLANGLRPLLLVALLSVWTAAVYLWFRSESVEEVVPASPDFSVEVETPRPLEEDTSDIPDAEPPAVESVADSIRVESRPSGASVFLDGRFIGVTPLDVEDARPEWSLNFRKSGYESIQIRVEDLSDSPPELPPVTATLRLEISPPGARLFLEDEPLSLTESGEIELPLHPHRLRVEAEGYVSKERMIQPAQTYMRVVRISLSEKK